MRTVSTFSFGALLAVDPAAPAVVDVADPVVVAPVDALSRVPVISTLCPTCAVSFASSASRRYVLPLVAAAAVEPAPAVPVGLVAVDPLGTFPCCPLCGGELSPEHAHYRCTVCGQRDSCCDGPY